jgi:hypothetical protein
MLYFPPSALASVVVLPQPQLVPGDPPQAVRRANLNKFKIRNIKYTWALTVDNG